MEDFIRNPSVCLVGPDGLKTDILNSDNVHYFFIYIVCICVYIYINFIILRDKVQMGERQRERKNPKQDLRCQISRTMRS